MEAAPFQHSFWCIQRFSKKGQMLWADSQHALRSSHQLFRLCSKCNIPNTPNWSISVLHLMRQYDRDLICQIEMYQEDCTPPLDQICCYGSCRSAENALSQFLVRLLLEYKVSQYRRWHYQKIILKLPYFSRSNVMLPGMISVCVLFCAENMSATC